MPERLALADLAGIPLILPSLPNAIRTLVEGVCRRHGVRLNVVTEVDAVQTIVELASQGQACALLPRSAVLDDGALAVCRIESPRIRNQLVLATPRQRPATRLAEATAKLMRGMDLQALLYRQPA